MICTNQFHVESARRRKKAIDAHNASINIVQPRFEIGDLVVVRCGSKDRHNLSLKWAGPRWIVAAPSSLVYIVEQLSNKRMERVQCTRLAKYNARLDGSSVTQEILDLASRTESRYEILNSIMHMAEDTNVVWLHLCWEGL